MTETYVFERAVVLICQCIKPCLAPFRDETGQWSTLGCLRETGHDDGGVPGGGHSLDGPTGGFAYRDPPEPNGPRIVMRLGETGSYFGKCHQCLRDYMLTVGSVNDAPAQPVIAPNYDDDEVIVDGPVR